MFRSVLDSVGLTVAKAVEVYQSTIVIGICEENTIFAASGSTHMLNSATGLILPIPCAVPPIMIHSLTLLANGGSSRIAIAILVKGARATMVISPGWRFIVSLMISTACPAACIRPESEIGRAHV